MAKAPDIVAMVRVVWLRSTYPAPGDYNQVYDIAALNYNLARIVPSDLVTVRYRKSGSSDSIRATPEDIAREMDGTDFPACSHRQSLHRI